MLTDGTLMASDGQIGVGMHENFEGAKLAINIGIQ